MRLATLVLVLAAGCKAGEVTDADQHGLAKPIESDRALPGAGAASTSEDPADTPAPANTEADDPWTATSTDPWAPTAARDEVTASPALTDDPAPWPVKDAKPKPTKRVPMPLR